MIVKTPTIQQQSQSEHFTGQSIHVLGVNNSSLDDTCRVAIVIQQIVTEVNGDVSEEKILATTKIVFNLMK